MGDQKEPRARERAQDYNRCRTACAALIRTVIHAQCDFDRYMELRDYRVFQIDSWARLTHVHRRELTGYLRGSTDLITSHMTAWRHWHDGEGRFYKDGEEYDARAIDPDKSAFVWLASGVVWMPGPKTPNDAWKVCNCGGRGRHAASTDCEVPYWRVQG